jgi:glutaredoxin 3
MSDAKPVTVYGNATCPFCGAARMLLTKKAIQFEDINVASDPALLAEMSERSGKQSVPQIFIGDTPIGGFDELYALDKSGELDKMLAELLGES